MEGVWSVPGGGLEDVWSVSRGCLLVSGGWLNGKKGCLMANLQFQLENRSSQKRLRQDRSN